MKAAVATENGLALRDISQPRPKPNEVLVKVRAAALNRADLATARGLPHGSHGGIGAAVGLEWAGEVVESGAEAKGYKPGDRVMCSGTGGYAEYAVSDWGRVNPMPNVMSETGSVAACSKLMPVGIGLTRPQSLTAYSA